MTTWSPFERRCATASVAAIPEANARPQRPPSSAARQVSRAVRVGLPVRAYSYPLFFPTASCANVEVWKIGTTTAPVAASWSCPAWMASVSKPGLWGVSFTSSPVCRDCRAISRGEGHARAGGRRERTPERTLAGRDLSLVRHEFQQVGFRDDRDRAVLSRGEQRRGAPGELLIEALDVIGGLHHREGRIHHPLDAFVDKGGLAEDAVEHRLFRDASHDVGHRPRRTVGRHRDLRDTVALHRVDRAADRLSLRDHDELRGAPAILHDVADVCRYEAPEESGLAHPFIGEDL